MSKNSKFKIKSFKKRGVAPVIAQLLLVAIAVFVGTVFVEQQVG